MAHDCVIVPGLGAVLAHTLPARMDATGEKMLAPVRVFTFNPALNHNDGVLAASVARAGRISYEAAASAVETAVADMRRRLDEQGRLRLGAAGILVRNADGTLRFVPSSARELTPASMWLPDVDLAIFGRSESVAEPALDAEEEEIAAERRAHRRRARYTSRIVKMAAAMALLFAVGLAILKPAGIDNPERASLGVESFSSAAQSRLIETPGQAVAPVVPVIERHSDAATPVDTAAYAAMRRAARGQVGTGRYYMVVASLASELEARKFVENSKDSSLGILEKDGRYRVYAAQGASVADVNALAAANGVSSRYPSAWVCRK